MEKAKSLNTLLAQVEPKFNKQNDYGLNFEQECHFAKQQILKSDFALNTAKSNQSSLANAIQNVSAIGISLNPALAEAYLVPRDGQICLDISYRGMVKLATESGAIKMAKAVLVYEGDEFKWLGPMTPPEHSADVFNPDRMDAADPLKNLRGGYCIAVLPTDDVLVDFMTAAEILEVKNSSKAKNGPWAGKWAGEMAKKTLVKRASKSWPPGNRARLDQAIHVVNQHEGLQEAPSVDEAAIEEFMDLVARGDGMNLLLFAEKHGEHNKDMAFNAAPKGEKTKLKDRVRELEKEALQQIDNYHTLILEAVENSDPYAISELFEELTEGEHALINKRLSEIEHRQIENLKNEAAA